MSQAIHEIEANIEQLKEFVALGDSLNRLMKNRDFKKLICETYLEKEAVRLVHLRAAPAMQDDCNQTQITKDIDAIGCFAGFLHAIGYQANAARDAIEEDLRTIEELESEDELELA